MKELTVFAGGTSGGKSLITLIRPGMLFHWTDGPKWVIDTMGFGFDPEVHGTANCLHADVDSAIDLLKGNGISKVSTCYIYASMSDFLKIREACPDRNLRLLSF